MAVVVITGASSGIGEATAKALAARGHSLTLAARRLDRLQQLVRETGAADRILIVPADVAEPAALKAVADAAGERFGHIDVWINNAGFSEWRPIASLEAGGVTYDIAFTFANDGFIRDVFEERVTRAEVVVSTKKQFMTMSKDTR